MKVANSETNFFSRKTSKDAEKVSSGFEEILERSMSETGRADEKPGLSAGSRPDRFGRKETTLVDLGHISSNSPTVSHLLVEHPEFGRDCWDIVHSELNENKPYRRIPSGVRIYLDSESNELVWKNTNRSRIGAKSRQLPPAESPMPRNADSGYDFFRTGHQSSRSFRSPAKASLSTRDENRIEEKELINTSILKAAAKYNLPTELIEGVIKAESNFQVRAVSRAGAQGLMQLMPATAKELGVEDPFDIEENIDGGAKYLRKMLEIFNGDLIQALAAYNAGPNKIKSSRGLIPYRETKEYVRRILAFLTEGI